MLWGGTQRRGKIWQQKGGSIAEWLDWVKFTWSKVTASHSEETNITRDFLRPERLEVPLGSPPIALQWGEQAQLRLNDRQFVGFDNVLIPLFLVDLEIAGTEDDSSILLRIASDTLVSVYRLRIGASYPGGYRHEHVSGPRLTFQKGRDPEIALEEQPYVPNRFRPGEVREQDIEQRWFPGVHSDVGGGYPENESGLSKIALVWLRDECEKAGLKLNRPNYRHLVLGEPKEGSEHRYRQPDPAGRMHRSLKHA